MEKNNEQKKNDKKTGCIVLLVLWLVISCVLYFTCGGNEKQKTNEELQKELLVKLEQKSIKGMSYEFLAFDENRIIINITIPESHADVASDIGIVKCKAVCDFLTENKREANIVHCYVLSRKENEEPISYGKAYHAIGNIEWEIWDEK